MYLLLAFDNDYQGKINIDQHDLKNIDKNTYYQRIAYVQQQTHLLTGSIRDNLKLGKFHATDAEFDTVMQQVGLWDLINNLAKKYDTRVGINEYQLSAGQIQRIGLARALLKNSPMIFLDEPTSSLDPITADSINHTLSSFSQNHLIIRITHQIEENEEDLARLLKRLSYYGIHEITADLILIPANPEPYGPGWMFEDMSNADGAPLGPFIINKNLLMIMINPAGEVGQPAELDIKSWSGGIELKNQISTAKKEENCSIQVNYPSETSIILKVCIAQSATVNTMDVAIKNPQVYLVYLIQKLLASNGIKLRGNIRSGSYPNKAWTMYTHQSIELSEIINDFLKSSINLYAEAVFLTFGQEYFHSSESGFSLSQKAEYDILGKLGIPLDQVKLVDGSGLSRYNLVTPASLMAAITNSI